MKAPVKEKGILSRPLAELKTLTELDYFNIPGNKRVIGIQLVIKLYSESRLMLSLVNAISHLMLSYFKCPIY